MFKIRKKKLFVKLDVIKVIFAIYRKDRSSHRKSFIKKDAL